MIVYDLQALQSAAHGERGIARYVSDLAEALLERHDGVVDVFAWNDRLPFVDRIGDLGLGGRLRSFSELRGERVDLVHVNSVFEPLMYGEVGVPVRADRVVVTCYDLIPYRFLDQYLTDRQRAASYRARLGMIASADAVVTDSESAAADVHDLIGVERDRLTVIGAGVGGQFTFPTAPLADRMLELRRGLPNLRPRYLLVPTGIDWRKNIPGVIASFGRLPADVRHRHQLVLACKVDAEQRTWIEDLAGEAGALDQVVITGFVSDEDLVRLYQTAELVVFPSFYEGFGLPVLEARRCGARVICSGASSLPEVLVDASARFDPHDPGEMAAVMERALTDPTFAARLDRVGDAGFTWAAAADRLVDVYRATTATITRTRPTTTSSTTAGPPRIAARTTDRRRLALVTILPPTPSGVADHSARLASAIGDEFDDIDLTVFVAGASAVTPTGRFQVSELAELVPRWDRGDFDRVVYCFGNNPWHRDAYQLLQIVPGSVFLHDVRLTGMFDLWYRHRFETNLYRDDEDPLFARPVVGLAESVFVQSAHAAELVRAEAGRSDVRVIDIGPHPCAPAPGSRVVAGRSGDDLPWVVTLGIASPAKRTDTFVAAARLLVERGVARAAIVGADGERHVRRDDDITVTGQVDDAEFFAWLDRASVVVQLRQGTNGESSGVVAHALAHGVPLVVSDIGAMSELGDDVASKVAVDIDAPALADAIEQLLADDECRSSMREAALAVAARETPAVQARRLVDALFG